MTEITVEELQENFDEIIDSVSEGEKFLIRTQEQDLVLIPYIEYSKYFENYFNHDESS
jgi:PHD/YefM family antitoxin component YafN of YafNO toxin-antitoxin module